LSSDDSEVEKFAAGTPDLDKVNTREDTETAIQDGL
jgi:hypothetical protein